MVPIFGQNLFRIGAVPSGEALLSKKVTEAFTSNYLCEGGGGGWIVNSFRLKYRHYLNQQVCDAGLLLRCVSDGKSAGMVAWDAVG